MANLSHALAALAAAGDHEGARSVLRAVEALLGSPAPDGRSDGAPVVNLAAERARRAC